jgi:hypothetical protein
MGTFYTFREGQMIYKIIITTIIQICIIIFNYVLIYFSSIFVGKERVNTEEKNIFDQDFSLVISGAS